MLDVAGPTWRSAGLRGQAIRERFGMSDMRYHQLIHGPMHGPEALAYALSTVKRLQRLEECRRLARRVREGVAAG